MRYLLLILIPLFLIACNPCKQVTKHPECFPADTIREIKEVIHYEKEYITQDSIIVDTIPCSPDSIVLVETKYKTIHKTVTDTIYENREEVRINPINQKLREEIKKLAIKVNKRQWLLWYFVGSLVLLVLGLVFKFMKV